MRRIVLPVALALSSLAFAPAPLSRPDRETPPQKRQREVAACVRRLAELGVKWAVTRNGDGRVVRFGVDVSLPNRSGSMRGEVGVAGDDLPRALRHVIRQAEIFLRNEPGFH